MPTTDDLRERLLADARAATGLVDFGENDFHPGLTRLLEAIYEIPDLETKEIDDLAARLTSGFLQARLYTQEGWRTRPDCLTTSIHAPLIIMGIPRTGTTTLYQLLSVDPQFQVPEKWILAHPQPCPPRQEWEDNPAYQAALAVAAATPEVVRRTHYVAPEDGDECMGPMAQSFVSNRFGSLSPVPSYDAWFLAQDMRPSFDRYMDLLKLVGANSPDKTWLLKNPSHVLCPDDLLAVIPDARVVHTHRHPREALGSLVSMLTSFSEILGAPRSSADVARREVAIWAEGMRRVATSHEVNGTSFCDVDYAEFMIDPIGVVRGIYATFALELTPPVEEAMAEWLREHPQNRQGKHHYNPEELGITPEVVADNFGPYMESRGFQ